MQKVLLDQKTFKALAAETRVKILKLLDKRQHTQSEIAKELKLSVPTVNEHIRALLKSNLIEKEKTDRKWKYFSLSEKGKRVLHPPAETMIWITLGLFVLSAVGAAVSFSKYFLAEAPLQAARSAPQMLMEAAPEKVAAAAAAPALPVQALVFAFAALALLAVLVYLVRKR